MFFHFAGEQLFSLNILHPPQKWSQLIVIYLLAREAEIFFFSVFNIAQEINEQEMKLARN